MATGTKAHSPSKSRSPKRRSASFNPDEFADVWQKAWNSHDPDQVLKLCTDDVVWDDPLTEATEHGHGAVRAYLEETWRAFPDLKFTYPEPPFTGADGQSVALHWRLTGTMRGSFSPPGFAPTGKRVEADGIDLLYLRDGKVARYEGIFDAQEMAQQLGLLPARGSHAEQVAVLAQRLLARLPLPTRPGR